MTKENTIDDLRSVLFDTLAALQDKQKPMDIDRALAIKEVAQTVINTAKAEVDFAKLHGGNVGSGFFGGQPALSATGHAAGGAVQTSTGLKTVAGNVTTHKMRG